MSDADQTAWRVWTEDGGLARVDPGTDRPALRDALADCAETLSPVGQRPALSTYWVDRLLTGAQAAEDGVIAHGNLWVLTAKNRMIEVRMDVDPPESEPIELVRADDLVRGLAALRVEVLDRLTEGHELDDRRWAQRNPA